MKAEIYTKTTCGYCVKAKQLLTKRRIPFVEYRLDQGEATKADIESRLGKSITTVPQIWLDDKYIGGFTELDAHFNKLQGS